MTRIPSLPRSLLATIVIAIAADPVHADPKPTRGVTCTAGGLREPPSFSQVSPGRAEYHFSGVCTTRTGQSVGYRIDGTWTPSETSHGNANASEVYRVDRLSGPSGSVTAIVGWRCTNDPWLNDTDCVAVGASVPPEPSEFWEEFGAQPMPASRFAIPREQRAAWRASYAKANGHSDQTGLTTRAAGTSDAARLIPPPQARAGRAPESVDATALNPQPLPPEPPPETSTTNAETAIIIVGGKPTAPPSRTPVSKKRVRGG